MKKKLEISKIENLTKKFRNDLKRRENTKFLLSGKNFFPCIGLDLVLSSNLP